MREEGGTPSIVGAVRAGMAFQLKEAIGSDLIMTREHELCRKAIKRWSSSANLVLLGNTAVPRLPIFSFLVRETATGQFLHHNFVCAVLNDVFGIQARGGCACAGPYAQDLLGIDEQLAKEIESVLLEDSRLDRVHLRRYTEYSEREILRPGFTRLNLPYFMDDDCVDFILNAVSLTAQHAWKLLPQYIFNPETGEWKQKDHQVYQDRRWLGSISYVGGKMTFPEPPTLKKKGRFPADYEDCLRLAEEIFEKAGKVRVQLPDQTLLFDSKAADLRWFMLPSEAAGLLGNRAQPSHPALLKKMPFVPVKYVHKEEQPVEKQCQDANPNPSIRNTTENEKTGAALEVLTNKLSRNDILGCDQTSPNSEGKTSIDSDHNLSCSELFQKTVEGGFVENVGIVNETRNTAGFDTNTMDAGVIGQSEKAQEHAQGCEFDLLPNPDLSSAGALCRSSTDASVWDRGSCAVEIPPASIRLKDVNISQNVNSQIGKSVSTLPSSVTDEDSARECPDDAFSESVDRTMLRGTQCPPNKSEDSTDQEDEARPITIRDGWGPKLDKLGEAGVESERLQSSSEDQSKPSADYITAVHQPTSCVSERQGSATEQSAASGGSGDVRVESHHSSTASNPTRKEKRAVAGFQKPPKSIFKPIVQALEEYDMIHDGDRVLVCLSGGKDSLSLLHTLRQYQFYAKSKGITFDLGGVTVDPQTPAYDPRPLIPYLASLGVPYFYEEQCIVDMAASLQGGCDSICSFCSRMKRGRLYACARREGYNVLAMGQHLDDLAESFLMSVFHNGLLRTMKANYTVKEGDLRVIRPLVYTREKDLREFAEKGNLPVIPENCPACFEAPKERHRTKQLLASQELLFPRLYSSLQAAMKPLMAKNKTGMESSRKKEDFFEEADL